jgi:hypothetical protein
MNGNFHLISKEQVVGHTIVIASMVSIKGCKIMAFTIGKGYCVTYSKEGSEDARNGFTESMEEAIDTYNSIDLGATVNG